MIIDCHGHYTTAPAQLGAYRDAQITALQAPGRQIAEKGEIKIAYKTLEQLDDICKRLGQAS